MFSVCYRVGVASFIVLLIQKVGSDVKPHTGMLLKLLFPAVINEKSWAAKRAFAGACAMVFKHTTLVHAQKLIDDTIALQIGDNNSQLSCGILMKNYSNLAFDVVSGYHAVIYPVIFAARYSFKLPFSFSFSPFENHYQIWFWWNLSMDTFIISKDRLVEL